MTHVTEQATIADDFIAARRARAEAEAAAEAALAEKARNPNFEPMGDRALVKRLEVPEELMIGSIVVPDQAKEKPLEADVIAVGGGRLMDSGELRPMAVKPGDRILIGKWAGTEIKVDGIEFLIVREDEILGRRRSLS